MNDLMAALFEQDPGLRPTRGQIFMGCLLLVMRLLAARVYNLLKQ